jgi:hypothetical protein
LNRSSGRKQPGQFLSSYELALPAICGQTGKLFVMVAERQSRGTLELVRAVPCQAAPSESVVAMWHQNRQPQAGTHAGAFCGIKVNATLEIADSYDGCPYCGATGYYQCSDCELFSCWTRHNQKEHLDHKDIWCEGCKSWQCTSADDDGEDSPVELTAYIQREDEPSEARPSLSAPTRKQVLPATRGLLK